MARDLGAVGENVFEFVAVFGGEAIDRAQAIFDLAQLGWIDIEAIHVARQVKRNFLKLNRGGFGAFADRRDVLIEHGQLGEDGGDAAQAFEDRAVGFVEGVVSGRRLLL